MTDCKKLCCEPPKSFEGNLVLEYIAEIPQTLVAPPPPPTPDMPERRTISEPNLVTSGLALRKSRSFSTLYKTEEVSPALTCSSSPCDLLNNVRQRLMLLCEDTSHL